MKKFTAILAAVLAAACMASPVWAADFTPSIQGKEAPGVETVQTQSGEEAVAIIRDETGNEVQGVAADGLIITPVAETDNASAEIRESLLSAYEQIQAADSLEAVAPDIGTVLVELTSELTVDDLVVRDLFDVTLGDEEHALLEGGNTIDLRFQLGIGAEDLVLCLHNLGGEEWEVIDPSRVVNNGDGTVTVTFDSLSPVAFVVQKTDAAGSDAESSGTVPTQTGVDNSTDPLLWAGLGIAVVIAGGAAVLLKVKKK